MLFLFLRILRVLRATFFCWMNTAKLSARAALSSSGVPQWRDELRGELVGRTLPRRPDLGGAAAPALPFLESVPEVSARLKEARTGERKFAEVVKDAERAAVLVLVY